MEKRYTQDKTYGERGHIRRVKKGHTWRGDTYKEEIEETTQGGDYTERRKRKHTKRRLHKMGTTRRRKRGHTKGGDIHGEPGTNTKRRLYRKGTTTEKGEGYTRRWNIFGDGANTERRLHGVGTYGEETTRRRERGYIYREGTNTERTTRRGDHTKNGGDIRRGNKHGEGRKQEGV